MTRRSLRVLKKAAAATAGAAEPHSAAPPAVSHSTCSASCLPEKLEGSSWIKGKVRH